MQDVPPYTSQTGVLDNVQRLAAVFINRWQCITGNELSTEQSFMREPYHLLGVTNPHPTAAQDYMFERPITFAHGDGSSSAGRIYCYKDGHFVFEAKRTRLKAQASHATSMA